MRIISVRQPWAHLIVEGHKPVENRVWRTDYRGPLLIHASLTADQDGWDFAEQMKIEVPDELPAGGIIGLVNLYDVTTESPSRWFHGPYGLLLTKPQRLPFTPVRGHQRLFYPSKALLRKLKLS